MRNRDSFQFTLILVVLFLSVSTLLFGFVYLQSLDNKFQSMITSPIMNEADRITVLEEENDLLHKKLGELQVKMATLENSTTPTLADFDTIDESVEELSEVAVQHADKKDVYIDQKCFEDEADLNQCAVLATAELAENVRVIVKPLEEINEDINHIVYEFFLGNSKITEFRTTTTNLFDEESIAEIVYLNNRDITIVTNVGISDVRSVYSYDGDGWIDYSKFSNN